MMEHLSNHRSSTIGRWEFAILFGALIAGASCRNEPPSNAASPESSTATQQIFQVKGVVEEVWPAKGEVRIAHEEITNYMAAMTMNFDAKNAAELANLAAGDEITFRLTVAEKDAWIDRITKTGATAPAAPGPETFRRVRDVEPLNVGDKMPEYHFTNELGQAVSLDDFKGDAVAITFIFTRCPFPTFCPRMSDNFAAVQAKLKGMPNAPTNWHLLTISFDPAYDTPEVLKAYAERYHYDPQHWSFLTGELIDITAIAEQFGLMFWRPDPNEVAGISHNLRTVVIDTQGRVQKIFAENKWDPDVVTAEILQAAQVKQ